MYGSSNSTASNTDKEASSTISNNKLKCYDYNYKGVCNRIRCSYMHTCSLSHPQLKCRIVRSNNDSSRYGNQQPWYARASTAVASNNKLESTSVSKPAQSVKQSCQ
ncbi:hypothetical protein KUTeg_015240 [Tegillarca granosa]|uniref:C3H1-type domain-containing protein n=1 Tax=Tegillarca granosa TaxID=220873 RepID=A0ABQ9ES07_TEGGR|nr:hypothetical protein KUTeg_015240 [Tegillarca granosa]